MALLYSRFSLIPQLSTDILPHWWEVVAVYWWNHVKTDKLFVESSGGIIWWDQPSSPARPPTRPRPPHTPRAAPRPRQRPPRAAPRSSIRRPLALFCCRRSTDNDGLKNPSELSQASDDSAAQTTNVQGQRPRQIFRRCQQMASHLAVAPLPRATAPSSPMICRRQPS
jgi:hypothetical protein